MFAKAVGWGYLSHNPLRTVSFLRVPKCPERVLSSEEEVRLLLLDGDRVHLPLETYSPDSNQHGCGAVRSYPSNGPGWTSIYAQSKSSMRSPI